MKVTGAQAMFKALEGEGVDVVFQEADITGITMPVTKHNMLITDPGDVAGAIREAFHIASTGRPGPVLVDLPKDVLIAETDWHWPERVDLPGYRPTTKGNQR